MPRKRITDAAHDASGVTGIKARTAAVKLLIERHRAEYDALYAAERESLGLVPVTRDDITEDELNAVYAMRRKAAGI